jgi:hypothetical protein
MVRLLTALAVHNKRTVKQGDCKFAFTQASLPPDELTIVKPPVGCPFSGVRTYWKLKKSLYGLRRAPRHWYNLFSEILLSPEIGLKPPADMFSKEFKSDTTFRALRSLVLFYPSSFKEAPVPCLDGNYVFNFEI